MSDLNASVERVYTGLDAGGLLLNTTYYVGDQVGTTQMEFTGVGYPVWKGEFAPFGQELSDPNSTVNHYKFTGKERDQESGLDYSGPDSIAAT